MPLTTFGERVTLQNTIASLKTLIPTLESAFAAAGITEKDSWGAESDRVLAQLEGEPESVRQEYVASQLQPPLDEGLEPTAKVSLKPVATDQEAPKLEPAAEVSLKPVATDQEAPKPALNDDSKTAEKPLQLGQQVPQEAAQHQGASPDSAKQLGSGNPGPPEAAKALQEPQEADEDDGVDLDEVDSGKAGPADPAESSRDWTGDVL